MNYFMEILRSALWKKKSTKMLLLAASTLLLQACNDGKNLQDARLEALNQFNSHKSEIVHVIQGIKYENRLTKQELEQSYYSMNTLFIFTIKYDTIDNKNQVLRLIEAFQRERAEFIRYCLNNLLKSKVKELQDNSIVKDTKGNIIKIEGREITKKELLDIFRNEYHTVYGRNLSVNNYKHLSNDDLKKWLIQAKDHIERNIGEYF